MNPSDLPIQGIRDDLRAALRQHQAVVIEGPTGCGKTTQVPQMLRDCGILPDDVLVGVTQPRRIAAIGVAERIAYERQSYLGGEVSYAIRFDDRTSPDTRIKVMTDGILLQEARTDPDFSAYGVIMVDEAHERSLNIDFTLGLLREVLDRRPDMLVVISSATINAKIFADFFANSAGEPAPRIEVEARTFPVDIRYEPIGDAAWHSRPGLVADLIERVHRKDEPGDILAFLTGEGEIKATMVELEQRHLRQMALLPLYGRLTREEQERVFDDFGENRKVVLATNIAETSITIDGITTVVDLGLAKVPSYDPRTGVSTLREEPISKASARQRAGRAGRTAPGTCFRLYGKNEFRRRPNFHTEEILRMDLSEVVLRLIDLGIHDVEEFPFVTPPPRKQLRGAIEALRAMGAIDRERRLTHVGKRMVHFPLTPRLARMVIAAADEAPDVLAEVITACALLSVRWPQVLPPGEEEEAREAHRHFAHPLGDLVAGIQMTQAFERAKDRDEFCARHYLDPTLMEELLLVREQLNDIARAAKVTGGKGGPLKLVVRCVATAFTRNICRRLGNSANYETAMGVKVNIHPGSCLYGKRPDFIVAAELVATGRPWARNLSVIDVDWIRVLDPDLADHWRLRRGKQKHDPTLPKHVYLFGAKLRLHRRKGQPTIEVPWELLLEHRGEALEPELEGFGARVTVAGDRVLKDIALTTARKVVSALPLAPPKRKNWSEGMVFEADRDLHHILRGLDHILTFTRSRRRNRSGFITLIHNGAGGYWYDVARDLKLAVGQASMALAQLAEEGTIDGRAENAISRTNKRLEPVAELLGT